MLDLLLLLLVDLLDDLLCLEPPLHVLCELLLHLLPLLPLMLLLLLPQFLGEFPCFIYFFRILDN
jgi:hypothetical protein